MINKNTNQYLIIDILRIIGTMFVILVYVSLSQQISLVRLFDICLLVLISGYICEKE